MGLKSYILEAFVYGNHFIARSGRMVDGFGVAVKNGDYQRMNLRIQSIAMNMLKMVKV